MIRTLAVTIGFAFSQSTFALDDVFKCYAFDSRRVEFTVGGVCYNHHTASCHDSHIRERCDKAYWECTAFSSGCKASCGSTLDRINDVVHHASNMSAGPGGAFSCIDGSPQDVRGSQRIDPRLRPH